METEDRDSGHGYRERTGCESDESRATPGHGDTSSYSGASSSFEQPGLVMMTRCCQVVLLARSAIYP